MINFFISFCFLVLGWVVLGVRVSTPLLAADGLFALWPAFSLRTNYAAEFLGGTAIDEIYGRPIVLQMLQTLGVSTLFALTLTVLMLQTATTCLLTAAAFEQENLKDRLIAGFFGAGLFGFLPALGFRLSRGHLNLFEGFCAIACSLALYFLIEKKRVKPFYLILVLFVLLNCVPSGGAQILCYAGVFLLPLLIYFGFANPKGLASTAILLFFGFLCTLPFLYPILNAQMNGDFARGSASEQLVYSYIWETLKDWQQSVFWFFPVVDSPRDLNFAHEVYFSFGPLCFLAFIDKLKTEKYGLVLALLVSTAMMIGFSSHIEIIANPLMTLFYPLKMFRVPSRAALVILLVLSFFAIQSLYKKPEFSKFLLIPFLFVVFCHHLQTLEIVSWLVALSGLFLNSPKQRTFVLTSLSLLSFRAFESTWWPPLTDITARAQVIEHISNQFDQQAPYLKKPLVRTQYELPFLFGMSPVLSGVSTLNGYWFPLKNFLDLTSALQNSAPMPTQMAFGFYKNTPGFKVLKDLYNIQAVDRSGALGNLDFEFFNDSKPIWASNRQESFSSMSDLSNQLKNNNRFETQWTSTKAVYSKHCLETHFSEITNAQHQFKVEIDSSTECPITLSLNYMSNVQVLNETTHKMIAGYVSDGALIGFVAPPGKNQFSVSFPLVRPWWSWVIGLFGLIAFMLAGPFNCLSRFTNLID